MSTEMKIRRMTFSVFLYVHQKPYVYQLELQPTNFSRAILLLLLKNRFKHSSFVVFFLKSDKFMLKERKPFDILLQK